MAVKERRKPWINAQRPPQRNDGSTEGECTTVLTDLGDTEQTGRAWDADGEEDTLVCSVC